MKKLAMKKLLIVTSQETFGALLVLLGKELGFDKVKTVRHEVALAEFLSWEPTHVLVSEYTERRLPGKEIYSAIWQDLRASAGSERIVLAGFDKYDYPDYIQLPFKLEDLKKRLLE